jgi:hypothetical protein
MVPEAQAGRLGCAAEISDVEVVERAGVLHVRDNHPGRGPGECRGGSPIRWPAQDRCRRSRQGQGDEDDVRLFRMEWHRTRCGTVL